MSKQVTRRVFIGTIVSVLSIFIGARQKKDALAESIEGVFVCTDPDCDPFIYDPALGDPDNINGDAPIPPGTAFHDLPEDWICPICGTVKDDFVPYRPA